MTLNPHSPLSILCSLHTPAPSSSAASLPPPRPARTARPRPRRTGARAATSGTASPRTAPAPRPPAKKPRARAPARPPAPPLAPPRGPPPARPRPRAPTARCVRGGSVVWCLIRVCARARVWEGDTPLEVVVVSFFSVHVLSSGSGTRRHDRRHDARERRCSLPHSFSPARRARTCRNPTSAPLLLIEHVLTPSNVLPTLHLPRNRTLSPSLALSRPLSSPFYHIPPPSPPMLCLRCLCCRPTAARAARCAAPATAMPGTL